MSEWGVSIWSAAVLLIFVMDPLGNIPVLLSILKEYSARQRQKVIIRELFIALGILLIFLFFGKTLLKSLHVQQEAVTITGGILLLIIGLRLIFPHHETPSEASVHKDPFIVPIAIPMIAGPSALSTLILMVSSTPGKLLNWFYALLLAWSVVAVLLLSAPFFYRVLRERGLMAVERLMGMLLVMMAVQMFIDGLSGFFPLQ